MRASAPHLLFISAIILVSLPCVTSLADLSSGDPLTIEVLMIDRGLAQGGIFHKRLGADPSISILGVPQPGHYSIGHLKKDPESINRAMRIYMPRNYQHMVETRDMILLREASCGSSQFPEVFFEQAWMSWFVDAVREEGMPLSMWGGDASWGGGGEGWYKSWGDTIIDGILPFRCLGGYNPPRAAFQKPHFTDPGHHLARLPWKSSGPVELLNKVKPKDGARLIATAIAPGKEFPWIAWWEQGKGRVLGETQVFGSYGTTNRMLNDWPWYQDFIIYLLYFGAGKEIPDDIIRAHRLRVEINTHLDKASLYVSLLEFVENFGASTLELYQELDEVNQMEKEAEERFRQNDYDEAAEIFEEINAAWGRLNAKAMEAKSRALTWVYLIEWFVVSGVAMLTGFFLWAVMIRRKLYREIKTTRTRGH